VRGRTVRQVRGRNVRGSGSGHLSSRVGGGSFALRVSVSSNLLFSPSFPHFVGWVRETWLVRQVGGCVSGGIEECLW